ncbi:MAG TPA: FHA domain-containing protein, partial [Thermoanaerobaculia bacterium]|nr:FHA domain-containing protein [Thermoanaerobaculia bacterium]
MTVLTLPAALRAPARRLAAGVATLPWSAGLPVFRPEDQEAARRAARVRRLAGEIPAELLARLTEAFEQHWPLPLRRSAGLELILVHPDGQRQKLSLHHRVVRIGRAESCAVRLRSQSVSREHCEIRVAEDGRSWLVDLGSTEGTWINGQRLPAGELRLLSIGEQVEIRPFRLVAGPPASEESAAPGARIAFNRALAFEAEDPFAMLGAAGELWVRFQAAGVCGYAACPRTWLAYAYEALGYAAPPPGAALGSELDRGFTSFLLARVAAELGVRSGWEVRLSGLLPGARHLALESAPGRRWEAALFDVTLGGRCFPVPAVWPVAPAEEGGREARRAWLAAQPFPVAVQLGALSLPPADLPRVGVGDVLLPDVWSPAGWPPPGAGEHELGTVRLALQGWTRAADLDFADGSFALSLASPWTLTPKGAAMP